MPAAAFEEAIAAASAARLRESLRLPELAVGL
jgi:hypothetical protein